MSPTVDDLERALLAMDAAIAGALVDDLDDDPCIDLEITDPAGSPASARRSVP